MVAEPPPSGTVLVVQLPAVLHEPLYRPKVLPAIIDVSSGGPCHCPDVATCGDTVGPPKYLGKGRPISCSPPDGEVTTVPSAETEDCANTMLGAAAQAAA